MDTATEIKIGRHVTWVGFWTNIVLALTKIAAGILGRSSAMVADGVHSVSDLLTDIVVLVVIGASRRRADGDHAYGHGKIETFASFIISVLLALVGIGIFADGAVKVVASLQGAALPQPGWIALAMAVVSIVTKEWLFRYTRSAARRINSSSMEANAWHHRSDAWSSMATLAGIAGAMFLGAKWRVLDPLAAVFVSVLIVLMSWKLMKQSVMELLETSLPSDVIEPMMKIISSTPGVMRFHRFRSRRNGRSMIVDFHIKVDPDLTIVRAHDIASEVERRIRSAFGNVQVNIHIEPWTAPSQPGQHDSVD